MVVRLRSFDCQAILDRTDLRGRRKTAIRQTKRQPVHRRVCWKLFSHRCTMNLAGPDVQ